MPGSVAIGTPYTILLFNKYWVFSNNILWLKVAIKASEQKHIIFCG